MERTGEGTPRPVRRLRFAAGVALAVVVLLGGAEVFLRCFPTKDLLPYLGKDSPLEGIFATSPEYAVTYRDFAAFLADNAERFAPHLPFRDHPDPRPVWAFFGNSFVHMEGMLADTARVRMSDRRIFNLGRNEPLPLRFAQAQLLLDNGLNPERVFFLLMPIDTVEVGRDPLDTLEVTPKGAIGKRVDDRSGPLRRLSRHSRLALAALVRSGRARGNPHFKSAPLTERIDEPLLSDLKRLFGGLRDAARGHRTPVTVLLVPTYHQIVRKDRCGFQDALAPWLREQGFDVFDPRVAFCTHPHPQSLFLPDKHFNAEGNRILLDELLRHLGHTNPSRPNLADRRLP